MDELIFRSNGGGTCVLFVCDNFPEEILHVPERSPDGEKITLVCMRSGHVKKIFLPATVDCIANSKWVVAKVVFDEGLKYLLKDALFNVHDVTFPASLAYIDEETFRFDEDYYVVPTIRAPINSAAHRFAVQKNFKYVPSNYQINWDADDWLKKFHSEDADYRSLRREVWENTRAIVEDNSYFLPGGNYVLLTDAQRHSKFYYKSFKVSFERLSTSPEITVTSDDCLDAAHKWVNDGLEVCVLNMASRRNPGGGVTNGAGAQEEYLFRCSDYYKFLYRYVPYAEQYGVTRSHYQYPLDRNFGGIFSSGVTIFRENETTGYRLTDKPWQVNMIAVAGMNSPRLIFENGEERIATELVEGVKNKIRTIFRIAIENGQKNLVLGAIGCGAFHNPPKHVAEIFRDVLCEQEFLGAFKKICFAVKTSHTSKGDTNFSAFKEILDGFMPRIKTINPCSGLNIKKFAISRDSYAILNTDGQVKIVDIHTDKFRYPQRFRKIIDIAGGFDHFVGLREDGVVVFESVGSQAPNHQGIFWSGGIAVDACEGHSAMLKSDGTVLCMDQYPMDTHTQNYRQKVESWKNIQQIALAFDTPYALTRDGKILRGDHELKDFQDASRGKIIQIAAFGCYYSLETIAALYANGTVKAWCDTYIDYVGDWYNVKKICCGLHGSVIGLTHNGRILSSPPAHKAQDGTEVTSLEDIVDIEMNFERIIALNKHGSIIYLCEER